MNELIKKIGYTSLLYLRQACLNKNGKQVFEIKKQCEYNIKEYEQDELEIIGEIVTSQETSFAEFLNDIITKATNSELLEVKNLFEYFYKKTNIAEYKEICNDINLVIEIKTQISNICINHFKDIDLSKKTYFLNLLNNNIMNILYDCLKIDTNTKDEKILVKKIKEAL